MSEDSKQIEVTKSTPQYKHTVLEGTCGEDVTIEDIKAKIYHPHFGGREAWLKNGKWRAIRHDD